MIKKALLFCSLLVIMAACTKQEERPKVEYQTPGFNFDIKKIRPKGSACEYVVTFMLSSSPGNNAYGNAVSTVHAEDCDNPAHKQ